MKLSFYPTDATYEIVNGKARVLLFGKTTEDKHICVVDESFEPYFYVIPADDSAIEKLKKLSFEDNGQLAAVTSVQWASKEYLGKTVKCLKVTVNIPKSVPKLREIIAGWDCVKGLHEYDILFARRYLIDKGITPMVRCEVEGEYKPGSSYEFLVQHIEQTSDETLRKPKILAIDIETYSGKFQTIDMRNNPILMIALYGENFKKVIVHKTFDTAHDYIEQVNSEPEMLLRAKQLINEYDPDVITGYFSDGFDLPYIRARADKFKIPFTFGPKNSQLRLRTGNENAVEIAGVVHVDVLKYVKKVMRGTLETEAFNLNAVAAELLGEEKKKVELDNLSEDWDNNRNIEMYCEYNIHDTVLAYELCVKLLPSMTELVKIVGLTIYDVNRNGYSQLIEWYLLRNAKKFNQLAPNKPTNKELFVRKQRHIIGGFVYEPVPGLYTDIVVFDYLSLYPTIISSHNIEPATLQDAAPIDNTYTFDTSTKGFIPTLIGNIITKRMELKKKLKEKYDPFIDAQQGALKLLANSFYGYLGFAPARWYSLESAQTTTALGRKYAKQVIEKAEEYKFSVRYADTDSCFISLNGKSRDDAKTFAKDVNKDLPGIMELEYEGYYPSGIFVQTKGAGQGAKKKYALMAEDGKMKIKGFETVRRNWSVVSKDVQEKVLGFVLKDQSPEKAAEYVKEMIKKIRQKKIPNEQMIIKTQLVKDIDDYAAKGPHVAVAQRLQKQGMPVAAGTIISFIITAGSDIIRERAKFPEEVKEGDYDPEYYIEHQVVPAVERILDVLGYPKEMLVQSHDQQSLSSFF